VKALKILLSAVGILVVAFLIAGLVAPNSAKVSKSTTIKAPAFAIFQHIQYFDKMAKWHPFLKKDPNLPVSVSGQDGTVGAIRIWSSTNAMAGKGSDEILEMVPPHQLISKVNINEPRSTEGTNTFELIEGKNSTTVKWTFEYSIPFPFNAFLLFQEQDSQLDDYFAEGLLGLKNTLERFERGSVNYTLTEMDWVGGTYLFKEATLAWDDIDNFISESHKALTATRESLGLLKAGYPLGLIRSWDSDDAVDYVFCLPVSSDEGIPEDQVMTVPSLTGSKVTFLNDLFGDKKQAHRSILKKLSDEGATINYPLLEEYFKSPLIGDDKVSIRLIYDVK
jgi:hypothetical protein